MGLEFHALCDHQTSSLCEKMPVINFKFENGWNDPFSDWML